MAPADDIKKPIFASRVRPILSSTLGKGTAGDPGLVGPDSQVWRVARERVLLAGGPAALLLQIAHPLVAAGVRDHSNFVEEPLQRLERTLGAMLTVTFGDRSQAEEVAARVKRIHARVRGDLEAASGPFPTGASYYANDPNLAMWVHATLVRTALEVYDRFVAPLAPAERSAYYAEAKPIGRLFGVTDEVMPETYADFQMYLRSMEEDVLSVGDAARAVAAGVLNPPLGRLAWLASPFTKTMAGGLVPASIRTDFGLPWRRRERVAFTLIRLLTRALARILPPRLRFWPHYLTATKRLS